MSYNEVSISKVFYGDKESESFRIATLGEGQNFIWAVVDKFGNIATPFFTGEVNAVAYSSNKCVAVGKYGKTNKAYEITTDGDIEGVKSKLIKFPYEINEVFFVGSDRLLFNTEGGSCFVDPNFSFLPVSDFYDSIYYNKNNKYESWIYEKTVESDELKTTITGTITPDGKVGEKAYDTLFNKERMVSVFKKPNYFDIILTHDIKRDLEEKEKILNAKKIEKAKKLIAVSR